VEAAETGVEVRVREEDGLAFQYPERITDPALDGCSPQSDMGLSGGCIKGGEERGIERRSGETERERWAVWHCEQGEGGVRRSANMYFFTNVLCFSSFLFFGGCFKQI